MLNEENTTGITDCIYGPEGLLRKVTTVNQESNTFYCNADHLKCIGWVIESKKSELISYQPHRE
jgi:hypothetical protein